VGAVLEKLREDRIGDSQLATIALTDSSGVVQTTYSYGPFGQTATSGQSSDNPYQFVGHENDSFGLSGQAPYGVYNFRARYLDTATGRFVSSDPEGFAGGSHNLYSYANSNPLNLLDPTGKYGVFSGLAGIGNYGTGDVVGGKLGAILAAAASGVSSSGTDGSAQGSNAGGSGSGGTGASSSRAPTSKGSFASCFGQATYAALLGAGATVLATTAGDAELGAVIGAAAGEAAVPFGGGGPGALAGSGVGAVVGFTTGSVIAAGGFLGGEVIAAIACGAANP